MFLKKSSKPSSDEIISKLEMKMNIVEMLLENNEKDFKAYQELFQSKLEKIENENKVNLHNLETGIKNILFKIDEIHLTISENKTDNLNSISLLNDHLKNEVSTKICFIENKVVDLEETLHTTSDLYQTLGSFNIDCNILCSFFLFQIKALTKPSKTKSFQ